MREDTWRRPGWPGPVCVRPSPQERSAFLGREKHGGTGCDLCEPTAGCSLYSFLRRVGRGLIMLQLFPP